jgi:cytochrome c biogenesis protein CcmG/thiol:disulfide interchange protein DsbE
VTVPTSKIAAVVLASAATVFTLLGLLHGAHSTARFAEDTVCSALRPDPLTASLAAATPAFEVADLTGKKVSLQQFRGKPVLVSFFATWCPPCVEEMPSLELLARRLGSQAQVLVVSVDEDEAALKQFFAKGTNTLVTRDESRAVPGLFGTSKFPETFLIGPEGKIRHAFINKRDWSIPEAATCVAGVK